MTPVFNSSSFVVTEMNIISHLFINYFLTDKTVIVIIKLWLKGDTFSMTKIICRMNVSEHKYLSTD